jgi:hypothetical protein
MIGGGLSKLFAVTRMVRDFGEFGYRSYCKSYCCVELTRRQANDEHRRYKELYGFVEIGTNADEIGIPST